MFYLIVTIILSLLILGFLILGEFICDKYPNSEFKKWWTSNVITPVKDDF
jgi:uncharacterized protein YneF (UPF0154 family)